MTAPSLGYLPRWAMGTRNLDAVANRKLFFGVGNHFYPRSRFSVGLWAIDEFARRQNLAFESYHQYYSAFVDTREYCLVRPETFYIERAGLSYFSACNATKITFDRGIIVHHNMDRELGDLELHFGGSTSGNHALNDIYERTGTENFPRLSIGIGYPTHKQRQARYTPMWNVSELHMNDWFLMNKFPMEERAMIRTVLMPRIHDMMEYAMRVDSRESYFMHRPMTYEQLRAEWARVAPTTMLPVFDEDDAHVLASQRHLPSL